MTTMNKVILAGRLTRDPQLRYTPSGSAVADMGLAVDDNYRSKAGDLVERTCFVDVTAWGRQAETCGEYLSKGSGVLIEGSLEFDQWENKQGEKRSKLRVRAQRVQFLGSPRRNELKDSPEPSSADTNQPSAGDTVPENTADNVANNVKEDPENLPF